MLTRIISGIVGVVLLVGVVVFMPSVATTVAVAIIAALAFYEFAKAVLKMVNIPLMVAGYIIGFGLMFSGNLNVVLSASVIILLSLTVLLYKKVVFKDAAVALFGAVYIFTLFKYVYMVRLEGFGKFLVFAIFIGAFITDTGAYFAGSFFGKHKLCPEISPKKTVEGSVGGVIATVLAFFVYGFIGIKIYGLQINYVNLVVTALLLSIISQIGDLSASVIKREIGIKDYGNIMPGHGGALDRFDSILFVAPVFYYLNQYLPIFVIK